MSVKARTKGDEALAIIDSLPEYYTNRYITLLMLSSTVDERGELVLLSNAHLPACSSCIFHPTYRAPCTERVFATVGRRWVQAVRPIARPELGQLQQAAVAAVGRAAMCPFYQPTETALMNWPAMQHVKPEHRIPIGSQEEREQ